MIHIALAPSVSAVSFLLNTRYLFSLPPPPSLPFPSLHSIPQRADTLYLPKDTPPLTLHSTALMLHAHTSQKIHTQKKKYDENQLTSVSPPRLEQYGGVTAFESASEFRDSAPRTRFLQTVWVMARCHTRGGMQWKAHTHTQGVGSNSLFIKLNNLYRGHVMPAQYW